MDARDTDRTAPLSPFHSGEQRIQQRVGVRDQVEQVGQRFIRNHMPDQHRHFYQQLPFLLIGHADPSGALWASMLSAVPGFISSPDAKQLHVHQLPGAADPLSTTLRQHPKKLSVGILGIEPSSRRRNRMSGYIQRQQRDSLTIEVQQTFGNCPKYIRRRKPVPRQITGRYNSSMMRELDSSAVELIKSSDTFFVASSNQTDCNTAEADWRQGVDISHRGGAPGFVRITEDGSLLIPDYRGNNHFNTLGNLAINPRAGLLFIDNTNGNLLSLSGTTEIHWQHPRQAEFEGALRLWEFRPEQVILQRHALPLMFESSD